MAVNYTSLLQLAQPVSGTESGQWGDDVNNGVSAYLDIAIAGGLSVAITTADVTLTSTQGNSSATNITSTTAQYAILNVSGAMTAARNLIVPSISKWYIINNATSGGFALTVKGAATTGITMVNGERAIVAWNGTDFIKVSGSLVAVSSITGTLPVSSGGTGATTLTGLVLGNGTSAMSTVTAPAGAVVGTTETQTLSNKSIQSRMVSIADATSVTIAGDTTDVATQLNTQAVGTLTINAPTGTPFDGQKILFRIKSTNIQTYSWNAIFSGGSTIALPTASTGGGKYDYIGLMYNSALSKWLTVAYVSGY